MKVSINSRTEKNLNEIALFLNQTNLTHTLNIMASTFLESLRASNQSSIHTKKGSVSHDREVEC
jgi:hypothetical protein